MARWNVLYVHSVFIKASSSPIHIKFFLSLTFYRAKTNIITEIADVWSHSQIYTHTQGIEKTQELSHGMNFDKLKKKRMRENFQFSSYSWIKSLKHYEYHHLWCTSSNKPFWNWPPSRRCVYVRVYVCAWKVSHETLSATFKVERNLERPFQPIYISKVNQSKWKEPLLYPQNHKLHRRGQRKTK